MGDKTKIEWTDATWNPLTGCSSVSDGCANCYASRQIRSGRTPAVHGSKDFSRITIHMSRMHQPLRWRKPKKIFVCSMGDLFHADISDATIGDVFDIMAMADHHIFQVLTKRPTRMKELLTRWEVNPGAQPRRTRFDNIYLGVTAENQEMADQRIPILLQTQAAVRFVSVEPCLGLVNLMAVRYKKLLRNVEPGIDLPCDVNIDALTGRFDDGEDIGDTEGKLSWVIVGCESGPGARPMHEEWARDLVKQCRAAGVPAFVKQVHRLTPTGKLRVSKDMNEWPEDLRFREFPYDSR